MLPDDPRHGSESGHEQHIRDHEDPCAACLDAKLKAARRRRKRKQQGHLYTMPAGHAYRRIVDWQRRGASYDDMVAHTGLEESVISRIIHNGPEVTIYPRTFLAIMQAPTKMPLTTIGAIRRVQALQRLGWPIGKIAEASGVHHDTILHARHGRVFVARKSRIGIARGYEALSMTIPVGETKQHRAGISRARNAAERAGWLPPLAWDDIDDALENPVGWQYRSPDRAEAVRDFVDQGVNATEAARRLHTSREGLEVWCRRNGLSAEYRRMAAREALAHNGWSQDSPDAERSA